MSIRIYLTGRVALEVDGKAMLDERTMRRAQDHDRERKGEMLNICVSGATGWTGRELVRGVLEGEDMTLANAVAGQAAGQDVGAVLGGAPSGVMVAASLERA